ncbi:hypothetical protein [Candidatus Hodarchaeum mangrovi]
MSFNGNLKKYGAIAVISGGILSVIIFGILLNATDIIPGPGPGPDNPPSIGVGLRLATRMQNSEDNISYIWCYNNSWVNINLTEHYQTKVDMIDGIRVGLVNDTPTIALIHEPMAEISTFNISDLNNVMGKFHEAISVLNDTTTAIKNLGDIWPPTFMIELAYENGSSLSIIYSKPYSLISVVNGTWTLSEFEHHGIRHVELEYRDDYLFLPFTDHSRITSALNALGDFIYELFPI